MADTFKFVQVQPFTLSGAGAVTGDTTVTLSSFQTIDGVNLAMTDFGSILFGTLEPGNGTLEEQISATGVVQNSNGTATLTGVMSVTFLSPYTETSGLSKTHAGASSFIISNTSGFYDRLVSKGDDETITGIYTFTNPNYPRMDTATPFPVDPEQLATKSYADSLTFSGAPNASENTKGISQLPTRAQAAAGTSSGSTGARMVIPTSMATATGASGTTVAVISQTNGTIDPLFVDQTGNYTWSGTSIFAGLLTSNSTTTIAGTVLHKLVVNAIPYSFTGSQGTTSSFLQNDGTGALTWARSTTASTGNTTRAGDTASGTQTIAHGLGIRPRLITIQAYKASLGGSNQFTTQSNGSYNGTTNSCAFVGAYSVTSLSGVASAIIHLPEEATDSSNQVAIATMDATNITLTWTKTGSPASQVIQIQWSALA